MRAILYNHLEIHKEAETFRSVSIISKEVEPAGHSFGKLIRKMRKLSEQM